MYDVYLKLSNRTGFTFQTSEYMAIFTLNTLTLWICRQ